MVPTSASDESDPDLLTTSAELESARLGDFKNIFPPPGIAFPQPRHAWGMPETHLEPCMGVYGRCMGVYGFR